MIWVAVKIALAIDNESRKIPKVSLIRTWLFNILKMTKQTNILIEGKLTLTFTIFESKVP